MFEILDKKSVELPQFHAVNLHRLPRITPFDVDNVRMAENISELKEQVAALTHQVNEIMSQMQMMTKLSAAPTDKNVHGGSSGQTGLSEAIPNPDHSVVSELDNVGQVSFADMFANDDSGSAGWFVNSAKKKTKVITARSVRKIVGGNMASSKVKAIPSDWHVFAGRLDPGTSESDVTELLTDSGIKVVSCKMLAKSKEWHAKYGAFHIVVSGHEKDKIFDECFWPFGADVRDWYFKSL